MELLQRNQLVWLQAAAWQSILDAPWDTQAMTILLHWAAAGLPLVIARKRADVAQERICVGLPAPTCWERRRLALDVASADVCKIGQFPDLSCFPPLQSTLPVALRVRSIRVYGSQGWQRMTGMNYVHSASDLDVLLDARSLRDAIDMVIALNAWNAPCRLDGEVVFPTGHAVAWRELLQAHGGAVTKVLVKHRDSATLMDLRQLEMLQPGRTERHPDHCAA
jgi:phosphoribosyl-dephospho-CoA transferase